MKDNRGQGIQESIPALLQEEKYACVYTHTHTPLYGSTIKLLFVVHKMKSNLHANCYLLKYMRQMQTQQRC